MILWRITILTNKEYLGDAVYVEKDRWKDIVLTTSDGIRDTNTIVLEYFVLKAFLEYIERVKKND